jgi:WD40 repeat protein
MFLEPVVRNASSLTARPAGAVAVSLATVLGFTALLGPVFLPCELLQFASHTPTIIIDHHATQDGRGAVLLTKWRESGLEGRIWQRVALYDWSDGESTRLLVPDRDDPQVTTVSVDGNRIYVGTIDQRILAVGTGAGEQPVLLGTYRGGNMRELRCSPDGTVLIAGGTAGLVAWKAVDGASCWSRPDLANVRWAFDPASSCLIVDTADGRLLELEPNAGRTSRLIGKYERLASGLAVSNDGRHIARVGDDGWLEMIDRATGNSAWPDVVPSRRCGCVRRAVAFSPCGRLLVTADVHDASRLVVWNVATGTRIGELRGHRGPVVGLQFTAAGKLHSWGLDGTVCIWNGRADGNIDGLPLVRRPVATGQSLLAQNSSERCLAAGLLKLDRWR